MILRWTSRETLSENKKENKDPAKKYETDTFLQDLFCKNSLFAEKSGAYGWLQQDGWVDENPVYENRERKNLYNSIIIQVFSCSKTLFTIL